MSIESLMREANNYFESYAVSGKAEIATHTVKVPIQQFHVNQYIRIVGSLFNDGVYKVLAIVDNTLTVAEDLTEETFDGFICGLSVPKDFIELFTKYESFEALKGKRNGVSSESVQGYYSVSYDSNAAEFKNYYNSELARFKNPWQPKTWFINRVPIFKEIV